jgi:hypothetical protein
MRQLPRPRIEGQSAWIGAELRCKPDVWTVVLSPAEIAEIQSATAQVRARGLDAAAVTQADFPLPRFGRHLDRLRAEVLRGRGFVLIRGLPVLAQSMVESSIAFCGIASYFGLKRPQNTRGHLLGHVRNAGWADSDPPPPAYQTSERQRFHTDRCDITGLLCLRPAKAGGLSSLASSASVYNRMMVTRPDLVDCLFKPLPFARCSDDRTGQMPWYLAPVLTDYAGHLTVGYTYSNILASQRHADAPRLTPLDREAIEMVEAEAHDRTMRLDMAFQPGDMQFVHNHTILHHRTAYRDWPEPDRKRHLLRLWLTAPDARPLPSTLAEQFGGVTIGDRGGICAVAPLRPQPQRVTRYQQSPIVQAIS